MVPVSYTHLDVYKRQEKCSGDILVDGKKIDSLSRKEIADLIALVPQTPFVIAGTIYENICYGLKREVPLQLSLIHI